MTTGSLTADDILLLVAEGATGRFPLDPIRLMKGAFLAWQQGPSEWANLFDFEPYDYGPFDLSVYRSRDDLIRRGFLGAARQGRYDRYWVTAAGAQRTAQLKQTQPNEVVDFLHRVGAFVTSRSFADLLREIYATFPKFAERSVFNQ
jgi:uncharacterized protein